MKEFDWVTDYIDENTLKFQVGEIMMEFKKYPSNLDNARHKRLPQLLDIIERLEAIHIPKGNFGIKLSRDNFVSRLKWLYEFATLYGMSKHYWDRKKIRKSIKNIKASIETHIERMDDTDFWFDEVDTVSDDPSFFRNFD